MYSVISTAAIHGVESRFVCVEADVSDGMPYFEMVGFLSSEVREAKERVRTALKNSGLALPPKRITVNLSPIHLRKEGNRYDLPVAVAVLAALEVIRTPDLREWIVVGEVGLDGSVHRSDGVLPIVCAAKEAGYKGCILPMDNLREGQAVDDIEIIGVSSIKDAVSFLNCPLTERALWRPSVNPAEEAEDEEVQASEDALDFSDICGQLVVKRACEVAVAGMHNFLMVGPPGSGKSMIASRIPTILPKPSVEEQMEITKIQSIAGQLGKASGLIKRRPFRSPHHTISVQGMVGGGKVPKPGEITLAHGGVLFLDELPEFQKSVLETLRQPLEEGAVSIVRASGHYRFPADMQLVCAMNPCSCGYYPDRNRCHCSVQQVGKYLGKISRPLLDRIDICVEAPRISFEELKRSGEGESSASIRKRVLAAHRIQQKRYHNLPISFNAQLTGKDVETYCVLNNALREEMGILFDRMNLTARGYHKILKVARTVADLRGSETIEKQDLAEAITYKGIDEKFFGEVV